MSRVCQVCNSPHREAIEDLIVTGVSSSTIARNYPRVTARAVETHASTHMDRSAMVAIGEEIEELDIARAAVPQLVPSTPDEMLAYGEATLYGVIVRMSELTGKIPTIQGARVLNECLKTWLDYAKYKASLNPANPDPIKIEITGIDLE